MKLKVHNNEKGVMENMLKTLGLFIASLVLTVMVSAAVSAQTTPDTSTGTGTTTAPTDTMTTTPGQPTTDTGTEQGVGGSGTMPSQAPSTGLGGLSN